MEIYHYCRFQEFVLFRHIHPLTKRSLIQNSTVMSLSDCTIMLVTLEKYKLKFDAIKVDTHIYAKDKLCTISKVHQLLKVKKKVDEQIIWINNYSYTLPLKCSRISQGTLSEFTQILSNGFNDNCFSKAFPSLLTCDMLLLGKCLIKLFMEVSFSSEPSLILFNDLK